MLNYEGSGSFGDGLIRLCSPDEYRELLAEGYPETDAYVFATTAFGDLIVWEKKKYVTRVSFGAHEVEVLASGFDFFLEDLGDVRYLEQYFELEKYRKAVSDLGRCAEDECYAVSPIPAIAGKKRDSTMSIEKIREYNAVSIDLAGKWKAQS